MGDLFTKGPDPAGVWRLVKEHRIESVLGNHDQRLLSVLAGERPSDTHGAEVIEALSATGEEWLAYLRALPLWIEGVAGAYTVVHAGLHPSGELEQTTREMALFMRQWPMKTSGALHWHAQYTGDRRVIFGHDARTGLVCRERGGEPWVVGLDSGCVYGRMLTGWIPETGEWIQVPAKGIYKRVKSAMA